MAPAVAKGGQQVRMTMPKTKTELKARYDTGGQVAGLTLAVAAGDLKLKGSVTDSTFINGPSLEGMSIGVEKPGHFLFDYDLAHQVGWCFFFPVLPLLLPLAMQVVDVHVRRVRMEVLERIAFVRCLEGIKIDANCGFSACIVPPALSVNSHCNGILIYSLLRSAFMMNCPINQCRLYWGVWNSAISARVLCRPGTWLTPLQVSNVDENSSLGAFGIIVLSLQRTVLLDVPRTVPDPLLGFSDAQICGRPLNPFVSDPKKVRLNLPAMSSTPSARSGIENLPHFFANLLSRYG